MSQAYLAQLLVDENRARTIDFEPCGICLREYDTLCSKSGSIEAGIRLPCEHVVGSACIAIWLGSQNTCPFCRAILFPLEEDLSSLERDTPSPGDGLDDNTHSDLMARVCNVVENYCRRIRPVSPATLNLVLAVLSKACSESRTYTVGAWERAAACIYMATHLMDEAKTIREISAGIGVPERFISMAYEQMYPDRHDLVAGYWPNGLGSAEGRMPSLEARPADIEPSAGRDS